LRPNTEGTEDSSKPTGPQHKVVDQDAQKYTEVVRNKQDRKKMPSHDCVNCKKFFADDAKAKQMSVEEYLAKYNHSRHRCLGTVRVFRQKFTLEDAIGSHACSLEANMRVTNGIPLGSSLSYRLTL
jgi:hypothetical protein